MKRFLVGLAGLLMMTIAFADIRESICIVWPSYSKETKAQMKSMSDSLEEMGYSDLASQFSGVVKDKSSFGSGFIYVYAGKSYVITNYHVIAYADTITIEIQDVDGEVVKEIKNCRIVARNEEYDLGIAEIPAKSGINRGLTFYTGAVSDGSDVWSAGYPGLGGTPAWQLGKGNITNAKARIEELIDTDKSYFIQHSAPIDAGNSGGPLLIKNSRVAEGYSVVGVNKAKAIFRETTNFAIPIPAINYFLNFAFKGISATEKQKIFQETVTKFVECKKLTEKADNEAVKKTYSLMLLMDETYALENGSDLFESALFKAPEKIRRVMLSETVFSFPANGLKYAIAYELTKLFQDYPGFKRVDSAKISGNTATAEFQSGDEKLYTKWVFENQMWKLKDYSVNETFAERDTEAGDANNGAKDKNKKNKSKKSKNDGVAKKVSLKTPFSTEINVGYRGFKLPDGKLSSGGFFAFLYNWDYVGVGAMLFLQGKNVIPSDPYLSYSKPTFFDKVSSGFMALGSVQVPISFKNTDLLFMPYFQLAPGFSGGTLSGLAKLNFCLEASPGLKVGFNTSSVPILLGINYSAFMQFPIAATRMSSSSSGTGAGSSKEIFHGFRIYIGVGF